MNVYLSGPMSGYGQQQVFNWRYRTTKQLDEMGIMVNDPGFEQEVYWEVNDKPSPVPLYRRDYYLLANSSVVIANMLNIKEQDHIGVWWELGIADAQDKLIIIITDNKKIIDHPFVKARAVVFPDFDKCYDFLATL